MRPISPDYMLVWEVSEILRFWVVSRAWSNFRNLSLTKEGRNSKILLHLVGTFRDYTLQERINIFIYLWSWSVALNAGVLNCTKVIKFYQFVRILLKAILNLSNGRLYLCGHHSIWFLLYILGFIEKQVHRISRQYGQSHKELRGSRFRFIGFLDNGVTKHWLKEPLVFSGMLNLCIWETGTDRKRSKRRASIQHLTHWIATIAESKLDSTGSQKGVQVSQVGIRNPVTSAFIAVFQVLN